MARRDKVNYYLDLADVVSKRGTCLRRHYGAVILKNESGRKWKYRGERGMSSVVVFMPRLMPLSVQNGKR